MLHARRQSRNARHRHADAARNCRPVNHPGDTGEEGMTGKTNFCGAEIKLILSDALPARTMVVSPDIYDLIANEGKAADKMHAETFAKIKAFTDLIRSGKP